MPGILRLSAILFFLHSTSLFAQIGCPGCVTQVNPNFPADTLYLQAIPNGILGLYYDQDISFRMPKTTTPVYAVDSVTPPNLTISKIEILGVDGVPPGLFWQPSQTVFETATQTDGCIKLCGTPTQSDSFILTVKLKATVFFISQETSFPLKMYVGPKVSITEGFTMQNFEGCAPLTTSFSNNIPSDSLEGYSYIWDFGDGTYSNSENPGTHTYQNPGLYPVHYQAIIDTNGYKLESITILSVSCVDQLGLGAPDLYAQIFNSNGDLVYDSSPDVPDATLPLTLPVGLKLGEGNYTLKVIDEDSGLKGGDDDCGTLSFNILSNGTLVSGGLTVTLNISHLADTIVSTDTVLVVPIPAQPVFSNSNNQLCLTDPSQFPMNLYTFQWNLGGEALPDGREICYCATESGIYTLVVSNVDGCTSSYSLPVIFDPNFDCTIATSSPKAFSLSIFPNPNAGQFSIRLNQPLSSPARGRICDSTGRLVQQFNWTADADVQQLELLNVAGGLYMVEIRGEDGVFVGKVRVE